MSLPIVHHPAYCADIPAAHEKMLDNKHLPGNMAVLVNSPKPGLRTVEDVLAVSGQA